MVTEREPAEHEREALWSGRRRVTFLPSTAAIRAAPAIWSEAEAEATSLSPGIAPLTTAILAAARPAVIPNTRTYSMISTIRFRQRRLHGDLSGHALALYYPATLFQG